MRMRYFLSYQKSRVLFQWTNRKARTKSYYSLWNLALMLKLAEVTFNTALLYRVILNRKLRVPVDYPLHDVSFLDKTKSCDIWGMFVMKLLITETLYAIS